MSKITKELSLKFIALKLKFYIWLVILKKQKTKKPYLFQYWDDKFWKSGDIFLCWYMLLLSHFSRVRLCAIPSTAAHQALPSLGFSRQEHWSGLPFPSPMHESEKWKWSRSVVSDPQRLHELQPSRLLCPWDFPGESTGVGCHCLDAKLKHFKITELK